MGKAEKIQLGIEVLKAFGEHLDEMLARTEGWDDGPPGDDYIPEGKGEKPDHEYLKRAPQEVKDEFIHRYKKKLGK